MSENPYNTPPSQGQIPDQKGSSTASKVIPYKNPAALVAYYTGLASLLPLIGALLGIVSLVAGIMGLIAVKKNPAVHGTAHAIIGIVLGLLCGGSYWLLIIFALIGLIAGA